MTIVTISGSRNPDGQTAQAIKAFNSGVESRGGKTTVLHLPELAVERCRQCDADGWGKCRDGSGCVIDDDFETIVEAVKSADGVLLATPVYYGDLAESIRSLLDRFRRVARKGGGMQGVEGKPAVCVCVAGGGGGGAPSCAAQLEKIATTVGFSIRDIVPARRQNLDHKCKVLELTGGWFVDECSGGDR